MGLIPIKADPRQFEYRQESEKVDLECTDEKEAHSGKYESNEKDTLKVLEKARDAGENIIEAFVANCDQSGKGNKEYVLNTICIVPYCGNN